jgi:hypothetical protein
MADLVLSSLQWSVPYYEVGPHASFHVKIHYGVPTKMVLHDIIQTSSKGKNSTGLNLTTLLRKSYE